MESKRIKVAVEVRETSHLAELDVSKSVEDIIREICESSGIQYGRGMFAIKARDFSETAGTEYVTEENKKWLRHGRQLRLSKSPAARAETLIDRLHKSSDAESSLKHLKSIGNASKDCVVLKELHKQNVLQHLRVYASVRILSEHEYYRVYRVMGRSLAKGYAETLCDDEINHLTDMIICEKKVTREMLLLAFEILALLRKNGKLHWPMNLLRKLTPHLRFYGESKLQEKCLHFINRLYLNANDGDERRIVFGFMTSSEMITYINKYVIREGLSEGVKHQLSLYQKIILQKYSKQLEAVDLGEEEILENLQHVISDAGIVNQAREVRTSREPQQKENAREAENVSDKAQQMLRGLRWSLTQAGGQRASYARGTRGTEGTAHGESDHENEFLLTRIGRGEVRSLSRKLSVESVDADLDEDTLEPQVERGGAARNQAEANNSFVPVLARNSLYYFILNDYEGFEKLLLTVNGQVTTVLKTGIRICGLLCKIFEIRESEPEARRGRFIPLCFLYYDCIIERMFGIAMKLYHRSRQEMRVAINGTEHFAVVQMAEDQLTMALESEPLEFVELEARLKACTVEEVMRKREGMVKEEVMRQLTEEPAFVELRQMVTPRIVNLIREKRLRFMEGGEHVHQFDYKGQKIPGKKWFVFLTKSRDAVSIEECTWEPCRGQHKSVVTVAISKIREVESGRKSNFHKEVYYNLYSDRDVFFRPGVKQQEPELEFPISLKLHESVFVDFCAGSQLTMDYWVDGLRSLIGENMTSRRMDEELDYLMDLELMEHLAGIEGIRMVHKAPPVPPLPPHYHFATE